MRILIPLLIATLAHATDITVSNVEHDNERLRFTVRWDNAWRNDRNHDAAWVFVRLVHDRSWSVAANITGHEIIDHNTPIEVIAPDDARGIFIQPATTHRGPIECTIDLELTMRDGFDWSIHRAEVIAIEMVYIPEGSFWIGDTHPDALAHGAFHTTDADANPAPFHVTSEAAIEIGAAPGELTYDNADMPHYRGDEQGPIPAAFPKGTQAFYIMKYEIKQGEYASFLNTIYDTRTGARAINAGRSYRADRGTIYLEGPWYVTTSPRRPANFVSWDDGCAFADWAGLRPMTELEFTKASRGPDMPTPRDYPWGTDSSANLVRIVDDDGDLVTTGPADESNLTDDTKDQLGASYWWVMDLSGSLWDRCVTAGHPVGRAFQGTHGDGRLSDAGYATNEDWPRGNDITGGFGYRGGGFYGYDQTYEPGHFNPWSPVAFRPYASWGGAPRHEAYGFRAVRTAP